MFKYFSSSQNKKKINTTVRRELSGSHAIFMTIENETFH